MAMAGDSWMPPHPRRDPLAPSPSTGGETPRTTKWKLPAETDQIGPGLQRQSSGARRDQVGHLHHQEDQRRDLLRS